MQEVNFFTMLSIVQSCQELQGQRIHPIVKEVNNFQPPKESKRTNYMTIFKGIVPGEISLEKIDPITFIYLYLIPYDPIVILWCILGTKWCGIDDIANSYFDLGKEADADKCCRAHDHCPMKIKALGSSYGIKNNHPYTK